jgi:hypothetical protein
VLPTTSARRGDLDSACGARGTAFGRYESEVDITMGCVKLARGGTADITVYAEVSSAQIYAIAKRFAVPYEITDEDLARALVQDLVERYLSVEYWSKKDMDQIVDGIREG